MLSFNDLLRKAEIDPSDVVLVKHKDVEADPDWTPYILWRTRDPDFDVYQARQYPLKAATLRRGKIWAVFIDTPADETIFIGLYKNHGDAPGVIGASRICRRGQTEDHPYFEFSLTKLEALTTCEGVLVVDWGPGRLANVQYAVRHDKPIIELRTSIKDEDWPGYLRFIKKLSEIPSLPPSWQSRLREGKGIYLLTCPREKEQYIGSARSIDGGFYQRWLNHHALSGDAIRLRGREPSDYQVSILEVAGSAMSDDDILKAEQLWIKKLQTIDMGLNGNPRGEQNHPPQSN
jgi:GIY-YIG catalytic domain